jgi:hypothetical protein
MGCSLAGDFGAVGDTDDLGVAPDFGQNLAHKLGSFTADAGVYLIENEGGAFVPGGDLGAEG